MQRAGQVYLSHRPPRHAAPLPLATIGRCSRAGSRSHHELADGFGFGSGTRSHDYHKLAAGACCSDTVAVHNTRVAAAVRFRQRAGRRGR